MLKFKCSWYTLNTICLSQMICKYFLLWLSFHLMLSLVQTFLILIKSNFLFFFITCAFDAVSKKPLPSPSSKRCIPMFSSKNFIVLAPKSWSRIYFELIFCICCKIKIQLHSFACEYPMVLVPFVVRCQNHWFGHRIMLAPLPTVCLP